METRPRRARVRELSPLPSTIDAFMRLVESGWDAEATRRPHGRAPRWWCISTSPSAPRRCIWVHCYLRPTGNI
ncbi:hypothetical protein I552_9947 [Mycobacterium xenopi 3993]|nr:hypothetical protein I552_9947 [Mycobacterium xenopi 3993]